MFFLCLFTGSTMGNHHQTTIWENIYYFWELFAGIEHANPSIEGFSFMLFLTDGS